MMERTGAMDQMVFLFICDLPLNPCMDDCLVKTNL